MPKPTKVFRVFISSTFTDMKNERMLLQKEVFPKLEHFCEKNNARFQAVDLRWGVNEESQLNQKTLDICLNEIYRCQRISPKPNFLILMGDKYGWQPIPIRISQKEMEAILPKLDERGKKRITQWYRLDTNADPAEYVLQPRGDDHKQYKKWEAVESEIRQSLRDAVEQLGFTEEQRIKYYASATHQEIMAGALNPDEGVENPKEHVFAFVREIEGLPEGEEAKGYIDLKEGAQDPYCRNMLNDLKSELEKKLGPHRIPYKVRWNNGDVVLTDQKQFTNQVFDLLKKIIQLQLDQVSSPDEIKHEAGLHEEFKNELTEHFCGRTDILGHIRSYLNDPEQKKVFALIGESGSGKSSVMAKAVEMTDQKETVYRFIGTSSRSSSIVSLLQSVCGQIAGNFGKTLEEMAGKDRLKSLHDINGISSLFRDCLALATKEKPIVLFLDALDQLSDTDNAKALHWLPRELPEHVRLVVSALPEIEAPLSCAFIKHLPLLPEEEAKTILDRWLQSVHRILTEDQKKAVLIAFSKTKLPIFLKLAFEQARHWHSYDADKTISNDVKGIINDFFDQLGKEHDKRFIEHAICYMLCGRYQGLTENEILEILAFDNDFWEKIFLENICHEDHRQELIDMKEELESGDAENKRAMKIPIVLWSRLYLDLEPFLTERDADGVPIITFFHRQFVEVLRERYGLVEEGEGA